MNKFFTPNKVLIAGHRGIKALYPENTSVSFLAAIEAGVDMIETDLRLTKDGNIVIIHDSTVDRTTHGSGAVSEKSLAEIKQLDAGIKFDPKFKGEQILTLEEFCKLVLPHESLLLNIEIKDDNKEVVDKAMQCLQRFALTGRCVFASFLSEMVAYAHNVYGVRTQGFSKQKFHSFTDGINGTYSKMYAVGLGVSEVTVDTVRMFKNMGIRPWAWCPDTEEDVRYCIACGIELMTCNDVGAALKVCRELGLHE